MIEQIRSKVSENIKDLDGVVGLKKTDQGIAPYLFQNDDDFSTLVVEPRYPLSQITSKLQKQFKANASLNSYELFLLKILLLPFNC